MSSKMDRRDVLKTAAAAATVAAAAGAAKAQTAAQPVPALGGGQPSSQLFWTVDTSSGKVMGMANGAIKQFKGIPYGAPTGGKNRFMPPKKPSPWKGVRECFAHGQVSPQTLSNLNSEYGMMIMWDQQSGGMGEDCLVLNVWTPGIDSARRAVLVSFHGGGWATGSGNAPGFDGAQLAKYGDVVVVTINHRLNTLGYSHFADLGAPPEFAYAGVAGVMDMAASLEWVRDNIERFGGDPGRVMIFGQSGGGAKTSVMLGNPAAKGLFHRAAVQSGSQLRMADKDAASRNAEQLLKKLGLDAKRIGDIQKVSWRQILQAGGSASPVMDGKYLTHHPFDPTAPAESADVPVIISTTLHDSALSLTNFNLDDAGLKAVIGQRFGAANADRIIAAQRAARPQDTPYLTQASAFTDASRARGAIVQAERKAALGRAPAYVYEWDWATNAADGKFGAVHGLDVSASFHNVRDQTMSSGGREGKLMGDRLASTWVAFAKTGNPNNPLIPNWPAYNAQTRPTMVFDREMKVVNDYRGDLIRMVAGAAPAPARG